jgi:hypothetical protein
MCARYAFSDRRYVDTRDSWVRGRNRPPPGRQAHSAPTLHHQSGRLACQIAISASQARGSVAKAALGDLLFHKLC